MRDWYAVELDCGQMFDCADRGKTLCIGCMGQDYQAGDGLEPMLVTSVYEGDPCLCLPCALQRKGKRRATESLHWMARYALMAFQNRNTDYAGADALTLNPDGRLVETTTAQVGWTH